LTATWTPNIVLRHVHGTIYIVCLLALLLFE
jgi:hypothetical protein